MTKKKAQKQAPVEQEKRSDYSIFMDWTFTSPEERDYALQEYTNYIARKQAPEQRGRTRKHDDES